MSEVVISLSIIALALVFIFYYMHWLSRKMSQVSDKIEKIEKDLYELRELMSEVKDTTHNLNHKVDLVKEIERLVEHIQVKKEEDKEKVKQFLVRKFNNVVS